MSNSEPSILNRLLNQELFWIFGSGLHAYGSDFKVFEPLFIESLSLNKLVKIEFRVQHSGYNFFDFVPIISEVKKSPKHKTSTVEDYKVPNSFIGFAQPFIVKRIDIYQSVYQPQELKTNNGNGWVAKPNTANLTFKNDTAFMFNSQSGYRFFISQSMYPEMIQVSFNDETINEVLHQDDRGHHTEVRKSIS